jgi:DNA-binding response OmpR family regulator
VLITEGHIVVTEGSAAAGQARAIGERFALILSDIGLPDIDGIQLVQVLRKAGIGVPILALSGRTEEFDR